MPLLVERHLGILSRKIRKNVAKVHENVLALLSTYSWPGNVRELVNVLEHAVNLAEGDEILPSHLPVRFQTEAALDPLRAAAPRPVEDLASLSSMETWAIEKALVRYRGNITKAAEALGISRTTLYRKMRKSAIARQAPPKTLSVRRQEQSQSRSETLPPALRPLPGKR